MVFTVSVHYEMANIFKELFWYDFHLLACKDETYVWLESSSYSHRSSCTKETTWKQKTIIHNNTYDNSLIGIYYVFSGNLTPRHKEVFLRNPLFVGMRLPEVREVTPLEKKFNRISSLSLDLLKVSSFDLFPVWIQHC